MSKVKKALTHGFAGVALLILFVALLFASPILAFTAGFKTAMIFVVVVVFLIFFVRSFLY